MNNTYYDKPSFVNNLLRTYANRISKLQILSDFIIILISYQIIVSDNITNFKNLEIFVAIMIILPSLRYSGLYKSYRLKSMNDLTIRIISLSFLVFCLFLLSKYIFFESYFIDTKDLIYFSNIMLITLLIKHLCFRFYLRYIRSLGRNSRNYLFWGNYNSLMNIQGEIKRNQYLGFQIYAWFSPDDIDNKNNRPQKCLGGIKDLDHWLQKNERKIDCIFFDFESNNQLNINPLLAIFGNTSLPIIYVPSWATKNMKFALGKIGNKFYFELWGNDQDSIEQIIKQFCDFIVSFFLITLLSPFFLIISLVIKFTSKGPIIFSQTRYGIYGKKFKIYKFRTMNVLDSGFEKNLKQASINDIRVTKFGRFLRSWSLDELPQLFNVLRGQMSIIGPRPHAVAHNEKYRKLILGYMQRHSLKPGITGLAQVNGLRGETKNIKEMEDRLSADLEYQNNWSLRLDLKILLKTIFNLHSNKAY